MIVGALSIATLCSAEETEISVSSSHRRSKSGLSLKMTSLMRVMTRSFTMRLSRVWHSLAMGAARTQDMTLRRIVAYSRRSCSCRSWRTQSIAASSIWTILKGKINLQTLRLQHLNCQRRLRLRHLKVSVLQRRLRMLCPLFFRRSRVLLCNLLCSVAHLNPNTSFRHRQGRLRVGVNPQFNLQLKRRRCTLTPAMASCPSQCWTITIFKP